MRLTLTVSNPTTTGESGSIEYGTIEVRHITGAVWEVTHQIPGQHKRVKPLKMTVFKPLHDSPWKVVRAAVNCLVGASSGKYYIDKRGKSERIVCKSTMERRVRATNRLQSVQSVQEMPAVLAGEVCSRSETSTPPDGE